MKKQILLLLAIFTVMFTINGCIKGDKGSQGPAGRDGIDGNANVIGTNTVTVYSNNWIPYGAYYYTTFNTSAVTQAIVDMGSVMVYEQNGGSWLALPYTFGVLSRSFEFSLNTVSVFYENTDGSQTSNPGMLTYRVVAISASAKKTHPTINWSDYADVKKTFCLEE